MFRLLLFIVFLAGPQVRGAGQDSDDFTLEATDEGVAVFIRPEADGQLSVRVRAEASASVAAVQAVIDAPAAYPAWVHRCAEAYVLPGGTPAAYTYYSRLDLPFPLADREVVAAIVQSVDAHTGILTRRISATPDALPANRGCHREAVYEAEWLLTPLPAGRVHIQCTVRTAAGAGLPRWVRKEIMTGGPVKTVKNLVKRVE